MIEPEAKHRVDKFALVLTGAPRGVSTYTWRKGTPMTYANTTSSNELWSTSSHSYWWQSDTKPPEVHVFICANNYDTIDRYLRGEDPRLSGLDLDPYIDYNDERKKNVAYKILDGMLNLRNSETGEIIGGKIKLNKEKWESYHNKCWAWADSVNFVYYDGYDFTQEMNSVHTERPVETTTWHNQYLHYIEAYNAHKEFFDSLTEQSVIVRQRYDLVFNPYYSLFRFTEYLLTSGYSNRFNTENWNTHHHGFSLSPKVFVPNLRILRGQISAGDYWSVWDGPGAQIFANNYVDYLKQNALHWHGLGATNPDAPYGKQVNWRVPEHSLPQFSMQHNYTIYHLDGQELVGTQMMSLKDPPILDQWRYYWYDWTEEMVEEIRQQCS